MSEAKWDIQRLNTGERSALKRNAGLMPGNNLQAMEAFYHALQGTPKGRDQENQWFACLCMECLWKPEDHPRQQKMEELLRRLYQGNDTSESHKRRIIALLDVPWGEDGYLLGKIANFVRILRASDVSVMPDFQALSRDLSGWNHPDRYVQRRWIRTICGPINKESEEQTKEKEEEQ